MNILSIQLGHNATALLMQDGVVKNIVSQERFDNIKNSSVFPKQAIDWLLATNGLTPAEIDKVAVCGDYIMPHVLLTTSYQLLTSKSSVFKRLYRYLSYKFACVLPMELVNKVRHVHYKMSIAKGKEKLAEQMEKIGIAREKLTYVNHHLCHAYSPAYFFDTEGKDWLILTMDGAGDEDFCTVNTLKNGKMETISRSHWCHSVGYIYNLTTHFLGMKRLEHEYKVMGLSAYAKPEYFMPTYDKLFRDICWLKNDGSLQFDSKFPLNYFEYYLREKAVGLRFDNIAGALQHFTEERTLEWVKAAIAKTGIKNVMTSGGVFMNVKLNKRIQELPELESVRFMPSCGDESNPFGAAFFVARAAGEPIPARPNVYLGHAYSNDNIKAFIDNEKLGERFDIEFHPDIEEKIAQLLSEFNVVARFSGAAEFGARSLGNRALLANPSDMRSFYMVNDQIKCRDFWMPFAPSVLDSDAGRYLVNPRGFEAPFMITAFDTTPLGREHLRAAMHQGDHTARPQIVTSKANPHYHRLLSLFKEKTGIGGVMNTSFNLHGYPLAETPSQAIFTLENSDLQFLAMENYLIRKRA